MRKKAFTMIELLVVIAIMGTLSAVIIVNYTISKSKARDAKRLEDIGTIASAIELYYEDNKTHQLPDVGDGSVGPRIGNGWFSSDIYNPIESAGEFLVRNGYLAKAPVDPSGANECVNHDADSVATEVEKNTYKKDNCYMLYIFNLGASNESAWAYARLENRTDEQIKAWHEPGELGDATGTTDAQIPHYHATGNDIKLKYGMNVAVSHSK